MRSRPYPAFTHQRPAIASTYSLPAESRTRMPSPPTISLGNVSACSAAEVKGCRWDLRSASCTAVLAEASAMTGGGNGLEWRASMIAGARAPRRPLGKLCTSMVPRASHALRAWEPRSRETRSRNDDES